MASTSRPRRLAELLQDQQEPFVLEVYLLERGLRPKSIESTSTYGRSSDKTSYKSTSRQLLKVARKVYSKLVWINHVLGLTDDGLSSGEKKHGRKWLASAFDSTVADESGRVSFGSCCNPRSESGSAVRVKLTCEAVVGRAVEDNKDCSPVSVLDEIDFLQGFSVYNARQGKRHLAYGNKLQKKKVDDSILLNQSRRGSTGQHSGAKPDMKQMLQSEMTSGLSQELGDLEACKRLIVLEIEDGIIEQIVGEVVMSMNYRS